MLKDDFYLWGEPIRVRVQEEYILTGELPKAFRIEYTEGEKVKAYLELELIVVENEEVTILDSIRVVKSYSHKKYRQELQKEIHNHFAGKVINTSSLDNVKYGTFYFGHYYLGEGKSVPRKVEVIKVDQNSTQKPILFAQVREENLYMYQSKLYVKESLTEWGKKKEPLQKITEKLREDRVLYKKDCQTTIFLDDEESIYVQVGTLVDGL